MLPDGFSWCSIFGAGGSGPRDGLFYRHHEVARLSEKIGGGWIALLRHPDGRTLSRPCSGYEQGKAGCELWAMRHREQLTKAIHIAHLEWLASQTWRGEDSLSAKRELERTRFLSNPRIDNQARELRVRKKDATPILGSGGEKIAQIEASA